MLWFVSIFFFATTIWLLLYIRSSRKIIAELEDAVQARRCLLSESTEKHIRSHGLKGLMDETNVFIAEHNSYMSENTGYSKQLAAMLEAVREVVVIFDEDRIVEFSNKAAEELFHRSESMKGLRVDAVIRSLDLLEFLEQKSEAGTIMENQVRITLDESDLWFEASCSDVGSIMDQSRSSSLMVLHDITRLKTLEMLRRDFVANVSHELRTPLTIIKGFTETLVDDHVDMLPAKRARFLGKVLTNAERLHMLVEDLLTLSRLESKTDQYEPILQPLRPLFDGVVEDYESRLEEGQVIQIKFDSEIPPIPFDRFRLNQVLDNFVENAFRYAPEFKQLILSAHYDLEGSQVVCSVRDDGPGISAADLPFIFGRFYRVDKGRSTERGGTGLGLSIVKHLIQLHGGQVFADSQIGQWTEMSFTLPLSAPSDQSTIKN